MKHFLLRWLVNFLGLWTTASIITGIQYGDRIRVLIFASLIFSVVNALIRPLVIVLALPAIVLTLGLFTLVVNASMLYLTALIYPKFHIENFWSAILAVVVIWLVNYLLTDLLERNNEKPI